MRKIFWIGLVIILILLGIIFVPTNNCGYGLKGEKCFCRGIILQENQCFGFKIYAFID